MAPVFEIPMRYIIPTDAFMAGVLVMSGGSHLGCLANANTVQADIRGVYCTLTRGYMLCLRTAVYPPSGYLQPHPPPLLTIDTPHASSLLGYNIATALTDGLTSAVHWRSANRHGSVTSADGRPFLSEANR